MGKRLIHQQMTAPTFNEKWLNREYEMTQVLLDNYHFVDLFRKQLASVKDLDKIARQLVVRKLYPASIFHLYNSIKYLYYYILNMGILNAQRSHRDSNSGFRIQSPE